MGPVKRNVLFFRSCWSLQKEWLSYEVAGFQGRGGERVKQKPDCRMPDWWRGTRTPQILVGFCSFMCVPNDTWIWLMLVNFTSISGCDFVLMSTHAIWKLPWIEDLKKLEDWSQLCMKAMFFFSISIIIHDFIFFISLLFLNYLVYVFI